MRERLCLQHGDLLEGTERWTGVSLLLPRLMSGQIVA